jgi:hypothetical protein
MKHDVMASPIATDYIPSFTKINSRLQRLSKTRRCGRGLKSLPLFRERKLAASIH